MKFKDITGTITGIVVLYYRKENESDLVSASICFISDDLKHVNFVYKVMKDTINYICNNITEALSKVHYFSDGCAGQYIISEFMSS